MQLEQAIFASADGGSTKGYQLVSRSQGIDRDLAQQLCRWAPSHASLWGAESDAWSLNFFPAGEDWVAITRSFYGGPEYSNRGGDQVVTAMLAVRAPALVAYQFDPFALARTALALGYLRLVVDPPERLPVISLPDFPILPAYHADRPASNGESPLPEIRNQLLSGRRVAVASNSDAVAMLADLIDLTPPDRRPEISFTTGLRPSAQRAFRLHFLHSPDATTRRTLQAQDILVCDVG